MKSIKYKGFIMLLMLLSISVISIIQSGFVMAAKYNASFKKGTETYTVSEYDETKWAEIIGDSVTPADFFGGDADKAQAKAKTTNLGWYDNETSVYEMLLALYIPDEYLPYLFALNELGINRTTINEEYDTKIESWKIYQSVWKFTDNDFDVDPNISNNIVYVFKNPEDYKTGLDIYNQWIDDDDVNSAELTLGFTFPNLTSDEFIWRLIQRGQYFTAPSRGYLEGLVDALDCEDCKVDGNMLILEKSGEESYKIEVSYANDGSYSRIKILDEDGESFYEISEDNTHLLLTWILLGFTIAAFAIPLSYWRFTVKKRRE